MAPRVQGARSGSDQARVHVTEATTADQTQDVVSPESQVAEPRHAALEGLRGVAILLVLAGQFWASVPHAEEGVVAAGVSKIATYGSAGVVLFFVLSGFWIARSLIQSHGKPGYFGRFFLRRACRVLPLYVTLLAGAFVASKVLFPLNADLWEPSVSEHLPRWSQVVFMQNIFMALTGSQGCAWLNPTWSLAVEVQFYLLLPVIAWFVAPRWLPVAAALAVVGGGYFRWSMHEIGGHAFLSSLTLPGRADSLFLGVLVACAWSREGARAWLTRHRRTMGFATCVCGGAYVLLTEGAGAGAGRFAAGAFIAGPTLLSLCFAGVVMLSLGSDRGAGARFLASRPLAFWGGISFAVYLSHQPVNSLLHAWLLRDWPQTLDWAGVAVTLASVFALGVLGIVSRRWLEGPLMAWSRRVTSERPRPAEELESEPMPESYSPPLVRWSRGLAGLLFRPTLRMARALVRVKP